MVPITMREALPASGPAPAVPLATPISTGRRPQSDGGRHSWTGRYLAILIGIDLLAGLVSMITGHWLFDTHFAWWWVVVLAVAWPVAIGVTGGYQRAQIGVGSGELSAVLRGVAALVVGTSVFYAVFEVHALIRLMVAVAPVLLVLGLLTRFASRKIVHRMQSTGQLMRSVVVVGGLTAVRHLTTVLAREPYCGLHVVGVCVPADKRQIAAEQGLRVIGDLDNVAEVVEASGCDAVAVTAGQPSDYLRQLAWSLEGLDVDLMVHPGVVEVAGPRMHLRPYVGLPLLQVEHPDFTGWRRVIKRATDVALSGFGLLVAGVPMLVIAFLIRRDGGPALFRQTRVGIDGTEFTMLKFRSMVVDAEARLAALAEQNEGAGVLFKMQDDPRITPVGKFLRRYSLDELPQLINVLRGDMSLVGPRPPLPREVAEYATEVHRRLLVKPGLTGLWQVSGRSLLSWEESVRLDLRYVENWCLSMDLLLMWKTVWAVLAKRGAF